MKENDRSNLNGIYRVDCQQCDRNWEKFHNKSKKEKENENLLNSKDVNFCSPNSAMITDRAIT